MNDPHLMHEDALQLPFERLVLLREQIRFLDLLLDGALHLRQTDLHLQLLHLFGRQLILLQLMHGLRLGRFGVQLVQLLCGHCHRRRRMLLRRQALLKLPYQPSGPRGLGEE